MMRPIGYLCAVVVLLLLCDLLLVIGVRGKRADAFADYDTAGNIVRVLGLSDLALSTEARYTRHPASSDQLVPYMDHPGAFEHFPSGSFFHPVR